MLRYFGFFAGFLTVISFVPQVLRAWRTRQTTDLSMGMFALLTVAGGCWIIYGLLQRDWPVVVTNAGMVALNLALVVAKFRFR